MLTETEQRSLVVDFSNKIFKCGLFKEADASDKKTLVSRENGISVSTLWMCGVIMVTIAEGDEGEQGYRQVTFAAQTDDPFKTVYFRSGEGTYQDLMNLINRAKDRFWKGRPVMKYEAVVYAGVRIG